MKKVSLVTRVLAGLLALLQATVVPPSIIQMVTTRLERRYKKEKEFEELEQDRLNRKRKKKR
jgi:hypothetical protein